MAAFLCPECRTPLEIGAGGLTCFACSSSYDIVDGVPFFATGVGDDAAAQAAWFDKEVDPEWEIERPTGAPAFHRWLLEEKVRRAVAGLELADRSVLTVCGGSGLDAELLARRGARVTCSDISRGAAARARERARRHGVEYDVVVADARKLPFADGSFDVAYVHDGLHHLDAPLDGLREMTRVTRSAVSVTEPADANVTKLAVRAGIAQEREEAGNRVLRLSLAAVTDVLLDEGFEIIRAQRYAMLYRHEPGWPTRIASFPVVFPLVRASMNLANRAAGRFGNKLCVVAVRL